MKGRVVILDHVAGREAAALMVDGRLEDLLIDPSEDAGPGPGAILRAVVDRPLKGQGGAIVRLPQGNGYLRQAKGLSQGSSILVQVLGVAEGGKAPPVTPRLLFKSRYAIVTPGAPGVNIARSIRDEAERDRLDLIAHDAGDDPHGLILRSAAEGVDDETLTDDIRAMRALAAKVLADAEGPPEALLDAPGAHMLAWRDWAAPDPDEVIESEGVFERMGVIEAVEDMAGGRLDLPGGAWAMIEPTATLVAVDVNTGADGSLAAGLKANLALARDLPRVLRIRGLAGQIVIDATPMPKKDRRAFEDALRRSFRADGTDTVLAGWTPLGNYELQRKRDRWPLKELWP